ncbi:MAG TPA: SlyX family protein [Planctomycetaceae bacterium]|jgi:SlyX protein|nr:SlyX family protein [Planctomycetaceae bacterium]
MTSENTSERVVSLEMALAHLQHDFEQVHHVALELQLELRQLTLRLQRLEQRFDSMGEDPEIRSPESERPPHY